jgi:hypothetical protein
MAMTITMKSLVSSKVSAVGDVILSWFARKYFCASLSVNGTFFRFCGGLCFLIALVMSDSLRVAPTTSHLLESHTAQPDTVARANVTHVACYRTRCPLWPIARRSQATKQQRRNPISCFLFHGSGSESSLVTINLRVPA